MSEIKIITGKNRIVAYENGNVLAWRKLPKTEAEFRILADRFKRHHTFTEGLHVKRKMLNNKYEISVHAISKDYTAKLPKQAEMIRVIARVRHGKNVFYGSSKLKGMYHARTKEEMYKFALQNVRSRIAKIVFNDSDELQKAAEYIDKSSLDYGYVYYTTIRKRKKYRPGRR
jgi:hypothetical protein